MQATPAATVAHSGAWHGAADTDPVLADEDVKGEHGRIGAYFVVVRKLCFSSNTSFMPGLIFDLDGTIVDTMPFYWPSWAHTCAKFGKSRPCVLSAVLRKLCQSVKRCQLCQL